MRCQWVLVLLLFFVPTMGRSAEVRDCHPGDGTVNGCVDRLVRELQEQRTTNAARAARAETTKAVATRPNATDVGGSAVAAKDFLPRIVAALGLGNLEQGDGSETLTVNLSAATSEVQTVLKITRRDPKLLPALLEAVPAAERADVESRLGKELDDLDDLEASLSFAFEPRIGGWQFGRRPTLYQAEINGAFEALAPTGGFEAVQASLQLMERLDVDPDMPVAAASPQVLAAIRANAEALVAAQADFDAKLRSGGFFALSELIANQPQLHFEAAYRDRHESVGADEVRIKATAELPVGSNINSLHAECGQPVAPDCLQRVTRTTGGPKKAQRFAFSLEYTKSDAVSFALPEIETPFSVAESERLAVAAVYGAALTHTDDGKETSRIDIEAKYQNATGDPQLNDRFVTTATYSVHLGGGNTLAFDLVYSSKPEYLGEVDHELSARAGLRFKLDKKE